MQKKIIYYSGSGTRSIGINQNTIKNEGYKIVYAATHDELLQYAELDDISCIIVNGFEEKLIDFVHSVLPLVHIISLVDAEEWEKTLSAASDNRIMLIKKPFDTTEFVSSLHRVEADMSEGREREIFKYIADLNKKLISPGNPYSYNEIAGEALKAICMFLKADGGSIMLYDKNDVLTIIAASGLKKDIIDTVHIKNGEGISGWVAEHKKAVVFNKSTIKLNNLENKVHRADITSSMSVTLQTPDRVIGVININSFTSRVFINNDLTFLMQFANEFAYCLTFCNQINEQKRYAQELQEKNKEMESFVYSTFHDIKTPLFTLEGFLDSFVEYAEDNLDEKAQDYLMRVVRGARKMEVMIQGVFEFFKYDKITYQIEPAGSEDIVNVALDELQMEIESVEAHIIKKQDKDIPWPKVMGDKYLLLRVWVNLIANAIKYRSSKRKLRIELGFVDQGSDMVTFYVKDNGIGIDSRLYEFIFKLFARTRDKEGVEGTGVGLSIIKKIIERHGGAIWLDSEIKKGTTFFFTLPKSVS
ncbi:MAG: ATP-binding protein [Elusimicrobiota bacterium]